MAVAKRCFVMAKKAGATDSITLTGGCAKTDYLACLHLITLLHHVLTLMAIERFQSRCECSFHSFIFSCSFFTDFLLMAGRKLVKH